MNNADLVGPSICAVGCFAANYSFSTVPYFSLDQPRNVTLVYNGNQAIRRPTIFADVNGDDGTGVGINTFTLSATVNGSAVTFLNGSTQVVYSGNLGWIRLAAQFDASSLATNVYGMVVTVKVGYADGVNITKTASTNLMVLNESGAPVAKGWTVAGIQHIYAAAAGGYLITNGDASGIWFRGLNLKGADYSRVTFDGLSGTYTRTYPDLSRAVFNSVGQETSFIEPNGRTYSYAYDGSGRISQIIDPYRRQPNTSLTYIALSYGTYGLASIQEPAANGTPSAGRTTSFLVDANRCMQYAQDPDGVKTTFTCDASGRLATATDRRGGVTTFGYNASSWDLSQITLPQIPVDAGGGSTTLTNPVIHLSGWHGTYATFLSAAKSTLQDAAGRLTSFIIDRFGHATDVTDPSGLHTTTTYYGILPTRITHPNGWTDSVTYDTLGRVTRNHFAGSSPTMYHYNASGLLDIVSGTGGRGDTLTYDANRRLLREAFAGSPRQVINYTYDPATFRVDTTRDASGHTTTLTYDSRLGNTYTTTVPGNRVTTRVVDAYGRDSAVTAPLLNTRVTLYDSLNRPVSVYDGVGTTLLAYHQVQDELYDANGNHYSTTYNALGWPIQDCDALAHCSSSRYDPSGLLMSTTNRRGDVVSVTRDNVGRVLTRTGANLPPNYYGYSADGRIMAAWDSVERDSIFVNPGSEITRATDSVVTWIAGRRYRVFHSARNTEAGTDSTSILSNTGVTFKTRKATYDAAGYLISIGDGLYTSTVTPTGEGVGEAITYGGGGSRTTTPTALHETQQVALSPIGPGNTFGRDYHFDLSGRIDQRHSVGDNPNAYFFGYDGLGRLQSYDLRSSCSASAADSTSGIGHSCPTLTSHEGYTYDAAGNRTDHSAVINTGNRYQSFNGISISYDFDGNQTQKYDPATTNRDFYWSAESQLDSVVQNNWDRVRYDYNAFGQPVRKLRRSGAGAWAVDSYFLWDGDQLLAEFDPSGNRRSDYIYFPGTVDKPFGHSVGATSVVGVRYHQQDALGNVIGTMDNSAVSQTASYDAWGKLTLAGNSDSRLFWKGLMWEGDIVGLYYMRNRWYDPDDGRFLSEDPAGFEGGLNLYTFAGDDPIDGSDPSGLDAACESLYKLQVGDYVEYYWEDSACPSGGGGPPAFIPDEPTYPQLPGGDPGPQGGGGGGAGVGSSKAKTADRPRTDWAECLTQAALLTGTFYLDMEMFGELGEAESLIGASKKLSTFASENIRRLKPFRRALGGAFRKNQAAGAIVDEAVSTWRQETWSMGPVMGVSSWWDAASLMPFGASLGALRNTVQACRRR
jgi:RHS repeat-associated protein